MLGIGIGIGVGNGGRGLPKNTLAAGAGAFTLTGLDATLNRYSLAAGAGAFALTGTDMTPKSAYVVPAALGTFALTGIDATLTSTGGSDAAETTAFLARANAITTLDATHLAAYKALINGLVSDGVWAKLDALYIMATQSSGVALLNMVSTSFSPAVPANGPTFTADRGYTGNGANQSLGTGFNPSTAGGLYAQDSAHLMSWQVTIGVNQCDIGNSTNLIMPNFASNVDMRINDASHVGNIAADPGNNGIGFYLATRTSSSNRDGYKNASSLGNANSATSTTLVSSNITLMGATASGFTSGQMAAGSIGGALTATDAGNYYSRLRTYMTAVGVP